MAEYIKREAIKYEQWSVGPLNGPLMVVRKKTIDSIRAADVVEVEVLREWLYKIALNNVGCPMKDMASACEDIVSRLDGLRAFARERRDDHVDN